jgi:uncharacterized protein YndB with AHSA1/START domain
MPDIHHQLLIGASAEKIYYALTSENGLSAWWTPGVTAKPELNSIARFPFGPDYFKEMKIMELEPYRQVRWFCVAGTGEWVATTIYFKLLTGDKRTILNAHPEMQGQTEQQNSADATLLIFHHDNWKEETPMYAECNYTWGRFLRSLKLFCETGKGRPWPNQHATS